MQHRSVRDVDEGIDWRSHTYNESSQIFTINVTVVNSTISGNQAVGSGNDGGSRSINVELSGRNLEQLFGTAMKAFIVNRFGDAGFLIGLFILLWAMAGDLKTAKTWLSKTSKIQPRQAIANTSHW